MNDMSFMVLKIVISVCVALITAFVVPYLKTLRTDARYAALIDIIKVAVEAAEQTITGSGQGAAKKEQVVEFVRDWLDKQGIVLEYGQLDALIESAVYAMKAAQK